MTVDFDRPAAGRTRDGRQRMVGLDVARALALIGVVVMNYHGMISYASGDETSSSLIDRIFDIRTGVLSTRFAAAFVLVAGVGVTLLTESARTSGNASHIVDARVRLLRRGFVLLIAGYFLDMSWPGTILFYYGIYFLIAAFIFRLSTRSLVLIAVGTTAVTLGVSTWRRSRLLDGDATQWVSPSNIESVQDMLARAFLGYTHPVFPWLVFLVAGMVIGRHLDRFASLGRRPIALFVALIATAYLVTSFVRDLDVDDRSILYVLTSMQPDERGLAYIVSTTFLAVLAFAVISRTAERYRSTAAVIALTRAGQLSLTLYLGHVLFYYAFVEWLDWGFGSGLGSAIALALAYWVLAMAFGSWWHHRIGPGPAEWLYRRLGG